jgi:hypothetical protein
VGGHRCLKFGGDAQGVVHDDVSQMVQAALEFLDPGRGALEPVGGADVEHQEPVDVADQGVGVHIGGQQLGVPGPEPTIAPDVEIPAFLGGDDSEVFAAGLGALPRAARHPGLDLVRRA